MALILGIESSCDDTSVALCDNGKILANHVAGQKVHQKYGGVVPELASRAHIQNIIPLVEVSLRDTGKSLEDLDAVAFTRGPGLMGSLIVGTCFAKSLSQALDIPLIEVNHMMAHVQAHYIDEPRPSLPFLCLTVSGGHTQIVLVETWTRMKVIGETIDDAAGEAFDKIAKMLGLPYPGGPAIDGHARMGNPERFEFPFPKVQKYDFSFSGLKTSVLYFLRDMEAEEPGFTEKNVNDICASIQRRIVTVLISKLRKAARELGIREVAIAGGVSANSELRSALAEEGERQGWNTYIPKFEYCTDNAAMIAISGYFKFRESIFADLDAIPDPRLKMRPDQL